MYCSRCGTWTPDTAAVCARCGEPQPPRVPVVEGIEVVAGHVEPEPAPAAPAVHYAGFWRRFAAMLVDGVLLFFPDAILRLSMGLPTPFAMHALRDDEVGRLLTAMAATTVAGWLYCALLESSRWRGTLGQQLLGMRVGDREGRRISFGRATGRYLAQFMSALLCGLGYLFNLWTPKRQTLHDMVAGCVFTVPASEPLTHGVIVTGEHS